MKAHLVPFGYMHSENGSYVNAKLQFNELSHLVFCVQVIITDIDAPVNSSINVRCSILNFFLWCNQNIY